MRLYPSHKSNGSKFYFLTLCLLVSNGIEISKFTLKENDEVSSFFRTDGEQFMMNITKLSAVTSGGSKGASPYRPNFLKIDRFSVSPPLVGFDAPFYKQ